MSIAFLYAAARFNAFDVFASDADITEYKSAKNAELKHFEAIYKKALINELKAFEVNFDTYKNELQVK